jgi:hypothetical protein
MIKLKINIAKVTNGVDLPKKVDDRRTLFYEMVVSQQDACHPVIRIPFHPSLDDDIVVSLWNSRVNVPEDFALEGSMAGTIARFSSYPLQIHFYKIEKDDDNVAADDRIDRIGFKRHIMEETSKTQDVPALVILEGSETAVLGQCSFISEFKFVREDELTPLHVLDEVKLEKNDWGSPLWLTQREFYGSTGVTSSHYVHRENLDRAINSFLLKFVNKKFTSLCHMLMVYGKIMKFGRMRYQNDTAFAETGRSDDAGDSLIELTTTGDCEDFAHFYMRVIRMLVKIYRYILVEHQDSDLYTKCELLAKEYVAFNYICRVMLSRGPEFHSTMLIVPRTGENPVISFEVTDVDKSYTLPSDEFNRWHDRHYFLVEPIVIHRLNRTEHPKSPKDVSTLTVSDLFPYNY